MCTRVDSRKPPRNATAHAKQLTPRRGTIMSRTALRRLVMATAVCVAVPSALAQPLPIPKPEQVGMSSQRLARIAPALKQEIDQGRLPGAVVMVARKGKLVYSESFGFQDKAAGTPMKADAVFRIYSMTKPLVSVAAMMLV